MTKNSLSGKTTTTIANHQFGFVEMIRNGAYVRLNDIVVCFPGKRLDNWMRLQSTADLIEAFGEEHCYRSQEPFKIVMGKMTLASFASKSAAGADSSAPSKMREHSDNDLIQQGTWAHPDIAIQFAQWCSPKFALWVSRQIRHLLEHGEVNLNHTEWTTQQHIIGIEYNRDDIKEMYG